MNNLFQLLQTINNPQQLINTIMGNSQVMSNPMMRNAIDMAKKGDVQGINELADNLCKEHGINRKEFEKQIKSRIGIN